MAETRQGRPEEHEPDESDLDRVMGLLQAQISSFAEQHDVPIGALSPLLLQLALTTRLSDYVISVEKPSAGGLKMELERMRRELDHLVRDARRSAEDFIACSRVALEEAEAETEAASKADRPRQEKPGK